MLEGGFTEQVGRDAYIAAFNAAQAFTVHVTGKEPKTRRGARTEFARLLQAEPALPQAFAAFLSNAYELKTSADYDGDEHLSHAEATAALATAAEMVEVIATLLALGP